MTDTRRLETVCETLAARGYDLERHERFAVARPTGDTDRVGVPGPLEVTPARTRPNAVLEAVGRAAGADRTALFCAHPVDASAIRDVLTDPPGLAAAGDDWRAFYARPDRPRAGDAGLACCRAAAEPVWREESADGVTGEGSRFVLYGDGDPKAVFRSVEGLACPDREAFPCAYHRDDDGRFRVRETTTDRTLGRFASVREMKANGYRPVPVPLVPERVVDGYLPEAWATATVEDGRLRGIEGA